MKVDTAESSDFESLIDLSREVEDFFGPMANEESFRAALKEAIGKETVLCVRSQEANKNKLLKGGIVIAIESNAILWFVVSEKYRGQGIGGDLLKAAINRLDNERDIVVQTFDESVEAGLAARTLYLKSGFVDLRGEGENPAGIPTVTMHLQQRK